MHRLAFTLLASDHQIHQFDCGVPALNHFLATYADLENRLRFMKCYVAADKDHNVVGFYTLSSYAVNINALAESATQNLPRFPTVPTARLGHLAVDRQYQGKGLGGSLIADAIINTIDSVMGAWAITAQAATPRAKLFYIKYGFYPFSKNVNTLFLPLNNDINHKILSLHF